jgi:hypothetical protein
MGGLRSQLRIVQAAKVAVISLFSAPLVIPDIQKLTGVLKADFRQLFFRQNSKIAMSEGAEDCFTSDIPSHHDLKLWPTTQTFG